MFSVRDCLFRIWVSVLRKNYSKWIKDPKIAKEIKELKTVQDWEEWTKCLHRWWDSLIWCLKALNLNKKLIQKLKNKLNKMMNGKQIHKIKIIKIKVIGKMLMKMNNKISICLVRCNWWCFLYLLNSHQQLPRVSKG